MCALLVLGLLVGASLSAVQPGIRDLGRDTAGQREAVRQISETVAKAFRSMVGDETKPALHAAPGTPSPARTRAIVRGGVERGSGMAASPLLRAEMLNLPPPALV